MAVQHFFPRWLRAGSALPRVGATDGASMSVVASSKLVGTPLARAAGDLTSGPRNSGLWAPPSLPRAMSLISSRTSSRMSRSLLGGWTLVALRSEIDLRFCSKRGHQTPYASFMRLSGNAPSRSAELIVFMRRLVSSFSALVDWNWTRGPFRSEGSTPRRYGHTNVDSSVLESAPASNRIHGDVRFSGVKQIIPTVVPFSWRAISEFQRAPFSTSSADIHGFTD